MSASRQPVVLPDTDIGGYTVEWKLGAGGFGAVYRARRGGRLYALKLIPLWGLAEWAEREVAILLRLKHAHLVRLRGHGQWPDASPQCFFIAMDYVEGRRLDVWATEENPTARQVLRAVLGVARGLGAAHRARVVHRDVKESNVLVRASDGEAVVVDFGAGGYESAPSITGGVLPPGTPAYRAPEAWRFQREHGDAGGRTYQPGPSDDLYALGVVLYWLLTGLHPFLPDEATGVEAVLHRAPDAPHEVNPRVPRALGDLCLRLLAKVPEERPSDAEALGAELQSLGDGAEASWDVPLCDAYGADTVTTLAEDPRAEPDEQAQWLKRRKARPRRGPRPPRQEESPAQPLLEILPEAAVPLQKAAHPRPGLRRAMPQEAPRWIARGALLALLVTGVLWTARPASRHEPERRAPTPLRATSSPRAFTLDDLAFGLRGQEVAPPWRPPEADDAADSLGQASSFAAIATPAMLIKEKAPVKMTKTSTLPLDPTEPRKTGGILGRALSLGVATCMGLACSGTSVRPTPEPEDCPPGSIEAMEQLDLFRTWKKGDATFDLHPGQGSRFIPVRQGAATVRLVDPWGKLPARTIFSGLLLFGQNRVYGRITEANTPEGDRIPMCIQFIDFKDRGEGLEVLPGGPPNTAKVYSTMDLKPVRRFE